MVLNTCFVLKHVRWVHKNMKSSCSLILINVHLSHRQYYMGYLFLWLCKKLLSTKRIVLLSFSLSLSRFYPLFLPSITLNMIPLNFGIFSGHFRPLFQYSVVSWFLLFKSIHSSHTVKTRFELSVADGRINL